MDISPLAIFHNVVASRHVPVDVHQIAVPTTIDVQPMQPADYHLTAGRGHFGANQAVIPGQGTVERRGDMVDVHPNDRAYWRNIPVEVSNYRLGGY